MKTKFKYIKRFASSIALLTSFLIPSAEAYLNPKVFKDITRYFKKDMTHYSPVIGMAALESGLIYIFRFYFSLDTGEQEGQEERVFSADKPYLFGQEKDAIFGIMYELFRSPAGTLAPHVAGQGLNNFYSVASPQKVALLLNYTQELSQLMKPFHTSETGRRADNLKINHMQALPKLKAALKTKYKKALITNEEKKKKGLATNVQYILTSIENCIVQENTADPEKKFLYPEHTTEQIILAYFCQTFNHQKDVLELLFHLNEHIIGADQHTEIENRLNRLIQDNKTEDDLISIEDLKKISQKSRYDIDDVYALTHAYLFQIFNLKVTPYIENSILIRNSNCNIYDRTRNKIINSFHSDCQETAARHLINLMIYDPESQTFNLTLLKNHMKDQNNPNFENFLQFYEYQTPEKVNDGSIDMRSQWNRVVGDLNQFDDSIPMKFVRKKVSYIRKKVDYIEKKYEIEYELNAGIINLMHVFTRLFYLYLDPLKDTADLETKKAWINTSLSKLFKVINPDHHLKLDLFDLKNNSQSDDVEGNFGITIQNKNHENLFSFNFYAQPKKHAFIDQLKILKKLTPKELEDKNKLLEYNEILLKNQNFENITGVAEDIWLASKNSDLIAQHVQHPLYKLLNQTLDDNESKLRFLKQFIQSSPQSNPARTSLQKEQLKQITRNVLKSLSWEDPATYKKIESTLDPLLRSSQTNQNLAEVFAYDQFRRNYTPLEFKEFDEGYNKGLYKNIKFLTIKDFTQEKYCFAQNNKLKELNIQISVYLETLEFSHEMESLSKLSLPHSNIKEIKGLHHLPNLEELNLFQTQNLETIEFSHEMKKLFHLDLQRSGIKEIKGLDKLTDLRFLCLTEIKTIQSLEFTEDHKDLDLILTNSGITQRSQIKGIEHLDENKIKW